ncbi:alpha- and gamma-adaptin-binding protein p34-like isoform X2 [Xyrauchen texanus]|uniref:alpha- and gamma-adaptin-binding protein p34-like isoform X2 n=1 Tax=Xyrauchen texanus TaxID=154827 RepID=UPI0022422E52|nr:alpha- and gamma-adaptin-binding protein p34-like isoform X2 [Xyrauchen texanus]
MESLQQATKKEEGVSWYPWTINNKYYTANVNLCVVPSTFNMNAEIARSMQAFIVYFDSKTNDDLSNVNSWLSIVEELAPEVLILVCNHVCVTELKESHTHLGFHEGVGRHEAQQWCLAHAFELVELNPQDLPDEDKSTGVKRIMQALNANVWSSVEMKDEHSQGFGLMSSLVASRHNNPQPSQETLSCNSPSNNSDEGTDSQREERNLNNTVDTSFDKASSLPHEQRKVHAEKLHQNEINGLSSGEEG